MKLYGLTPVAFDFTGFQERNPAPNVFVAACIYALTNLAFRCGVKWKVNLMPKKVNGFSRMNIILISIISALIFCYIFLALMIGLKDNRLSSFFKGTDFKILYHGAEQVKNNQVNNLYDIKFL